MGDMFSWLFEPSRPRASAPAPSSPAGWQPAPPAGPQGPPPSTGSGVQPARPALPHVVIPASPDLRYDRCFAFTDHEEGGIADRPLHEDPGGVTNRGVSLRFARSLGTSFDLDGDGDVDRDDILLVKPEHAHWAFREAFWRPCRGDELWPGLDLMVFDCAVHSGPLRATRIMQTALGQQPDGLIGPRTMGAIAAASDVGRRLAVIGRYADERASWLRTLRNASTNPGWWPRVERARNQARRWAQEAK